ncbi:MAG: hypothetical protein ACE5FO_13615 [Parvularculaceae bacterium]
MAEEDDKPPEEGGKTLVIRAEKSQVTEDEAIALLIDAGETESDIEVIEADRDEDAVEFSEHDCVIIPLEEATMDDDRVDRLVLKAAQAACSIIGVWVPGERRETIHPAIARYGKAQVPWDAAKLRDVLHTDCPPPYQTAVWDPEQRA